MSDPIREKFNALDEEAWLQHRTRESAAWRELRRRKARADDDYSHAVKNSWAEYTERLRELIKAAQEERESTNGPTP